MLRIETYVAPSTIHGVGVFSAQVVEKGALIWEFESNFDRRYTESEYLGLNPLIHEYFKVYGYKDKQDGLYYLTIDNDRFTNHSDSPNTFVDENGNCYAIRMIEKGEELTSNYRDFYADWERIFPFMMSEETYAKQQTV